MNVLARRAVLERPRARGVACDRSTPTVLSSSLVGSGASNNPSAAAIRFTSPRMAPALTRTTRACLSIRPGEVAALHYSRSCPAAGSGWPPGITPPLAARPQSGPGRRGFREENAHRTARKGACQRPATRSVRRSAICDRFSESRPRPARRTSEPVYRVACSAGNATPDDGTRAIREPGSGTGSNQSARPQHGMGCRYVDHGRQGCQVWQKERPRFRDPGGKCSGHSCRGIPSIGIRCRE